MDFKRIYKKCVCIGDAVFWRGSRGGGDYLPVIFLTIEILKLQIVIPIGYLNSKKGRYGMKYIVKNLNSFLKNQPLIMLLIAISVFAASIMINFSFGIYCNYREKKLSEIDELRHIQIEIDENAELTKSMLEHCFLQLPKDLENLIDTILVSAEVDDSLKIECRFAAKNGKYVPSAVFRDNLLKANLADHYFSQEQEENGELVALYWDSLKNSKSNSLEISLPIHEDSIEIQGKTYKIIGFQSFIENKPIIPFSSLNSATKIDTKDGIYLNFSKAIMKPQYDELCDIINNNLGDIVQIPPLPLSDNQDGSLYNTIMLIAVCIAIIAAINFAILFQYMMMQREKMLAVYRICGMKKNRAVLTYLAECIIIIVPVYFMGTLVFHFAVLPVLSGIIDSIQTAYSLSMYIRLFLTYVISSIIVLLAIISMGIYRKKIVDSI